MSSKEKMGPKKRNFKSRNPSEWVGQIVVSAKDISNKFNLFGSTADLSHPPC
jgi:hypothetical protein